MSWTGISRRASRSEAEASSILIPMYVKRYGPLSSLQNEVEVWIMLWPSSSRDWLRLSGLPFPSPHGRNCSNCSSSRWWSFSCLCESILYVEPLATNFHVISAGGQIVPINMTRLTVPGSEMLVPYCYCAHFLLLQTVRTMRSCSKKWSFLDFVFSVLSPLPLMPQWILSYSQPQQWCSPLQSWCSPRCCPKTCSSSRPPQASPAPSPLSCVWWTCSSASTPQTASFIWQCQGWHQWGAIQCSKVTLTTFY
jgi:hypothetical protein